MRATITQRELRNDSATIMDRVEAGEQFTVTRNGRPVAQLLPITGPRQAVPIAEVSAAFARWPRLDYATLRAEADAFFEDNGDRVG
ncbi:MAG: type II toxin-antitoxin system prevent-host-death family antitoxin [Propionibacteriaceae bacterium]|jgi:prevent-host-death family protein|nr:type II toxin-antitoxin system prevent-host-death family antitoxin [Propionibacteriaceae bacterium]